MKTKQKQFEFVSVLEDSFRAHEKRIIKYMVENSAQYRVYARTITPDHSDSVAVYARVAFAILSANAPFEESVKALDVVIEHRGHVEWRDLMFAGMVPAKAKYCNEAWEKISATGYAGSFLRHTDESWHEYRLRLQRTFKGLGLAKASFAACLLYPLEADICCVDTWVQKVFLGHTGFKSLSRETYQIVEAKIRTYARKFGVSTFIAQWLIWDHARGGTKNSHDIFPGAHKNDL